MEFSKIIKKIRKDNDLTQEQLSEKLNVSRQAISNWETDNNLPDIEIIINIAKVFSISLDELILGGKNVTKMQNKLIKDGSENKRAKTYMLSNIIGVIFCILGFVAILLKGLTVEYVDESGILHENFFLLPIGFLFILIGIIIVLVGIMYYFKKTNDRHYVLCKIGYILSGVSLVTTLLIYSNGNRVSVLTIASTIIGFGLIIFAKLKKDK